MTTLDPALFAKLVDSYTSEFGELFQIAEEQRDTFDRNREILLEILETDKPKLCDTDTTRNLIASDFGVVSSDHPVAIMGINMLQWMIKRTKSYFQTYERTYQLALSAIDLLTGMTRVFFIIVGSFRSVLDDGSLIPNNNLCRSVFEDVFKSMDRMYLLVLDAYTLFLTDLELNVKYEVPNRMQKINTFVTLQLPLDSPTISKRYVNILTEIVEIMLADFSEFAFVLLLSCRECASSDQYDLVVYVTEEIIDEAKTIIIKLEEKWSDFIKYSEEENSSESTTKTAQKEYIKRVKHSKEYILLKDTSKLRRSLGEFDSFLEMLEKSGFDMINKSVSSDQVAQVLRNQSESYQHHLEALKSAIERHEMQFRILTKGKHRRLLTPMEDSSKNYGVKENEAVDLSETKDEVPIPKLEYENEAVENLDDEEFCEADNSVGDEFFQTKGGLNDSKSDECTNVDGDSREQEKLFKFVVRELKGKLTDVSAVMKEREKKAKRKVYGEDESSSEEDEEDEFLKSKQLRSEIFHDTQSSAKNIGFELEGISDPDPAIQQENSLACDGFPVFLNSELRNAINLRLKQCVTEEFECSDDESESTNI